MKIAMLYAYHILDNGWSTPIGLKNALERLGHTTEDFNLYELDENGRSIGYTDAGLSEFLDQQHNFDFLLHMDYGMFFSPLFKYVTIPKVLEAGDDPQKFPQNFIKAADFDLILTPDHVVLKKYQEAGYTAKYFGHHADQDIHVNLPEIVPDKFIVTTVDENRGNGLIKYLRANLNSLWLDDRYFYASDHTRFLNRGLAVFQKSQFGEITRRPFEAAACGRLIFADRLVPERKFESIFTHGESIIFYNNKEDALQKILHYAQNIEETKRIAQNGQKIVLEEHTTDVRAKQLIKHVEELI